MQQILLKNFNKQLSKLIKSIFPTDDALFKMLYLTTIDIYKTTSIIDSFTITAIFF